jgi:sugar/nucleoside kinase (ribokinase family)
VKWLHVTGFSLSASTTCEQAFHRALDMIPEDASVSFDPNIRPEILSVDQIKKLCGRFIDRAQVVFPSMHEASMFTNASDDDEGCRIWRKAGKLVVLKNGRKGCRVYGDEGIFDVPTFDVEEVDPTGAGDAFCAAFLTGLIEGKSLRETARFANAVGALSVRKMGPMEGIPTRAEVESFLRSRGVSA